MDMNLGTRGATVTSWSESSPRDLLRRIVEENPRAGKEELGTLFRDAMMAEENKDFLEAAVEYCFANTWHSLARPTRPKAAARQREAIEHAKATIKIKATQMVLLDLALPHGKTLGQSTGGECKLLAPRMGKWLANIAKEVAVDAIVGDTLTEERVRSLYAA